MSKICYVCKKSKKVLNLEKAYKRKNGTVKQYLVCRDCNTKRFRESKRKNGPEYIREISKRTYEKHKEKWLARAKVHLAVKNGLLIKPKKCEVCELKKPLQGHHPDYTKPLEVIWLCSGCHADEHNRLKREKQLLAPLHNI